ncbi:MAG: hypothetical protein EBS53_12660 [Bacteroidetes bacterium]|nr:hypothetical protein [Bacteroidota bacterium]
MPKIIQTTVYTLAELEAMGNPTAITKAMCWLREVAVDDGWWDTIYMDAENIGAKILAFDTYHYTIKFRLQHDAPTVALAIKREHGEACETYKLAADFLSKYDDYHGVNGKITLINRDAVTASDLHPLNELEDEWGEIERKFEKDLGQEYLAMLKDDYDARLEDNYIRELAASNEYTFTNMGKRFG